MLLYQLVLLITVGSSSFAAVLHTEPPSTTELKQIHIVFRHGDRAPDAGSTYPTDPHLNDTYYPIGLGGLTLRGQRQEFNIGKALRDKREYDEFLGTIYTPDVLEATSTWFNRTKMSLELALAGLWPPHFSQTWNPDIPWLPIPYNYETEDDPQYLCIPQLQCPKFEAEYEEIVQGDYVQDYLSAHADLIQYINFHSGLDCKTVRDLFGLYFGLYAEEQTGRTLPEWTKKVFPTFLRNNAVLEYQLQTSRDSMKKASGGRFLKKVIQDSKALINKKPGDTFPKILLYSGHEMNVAHVLGAMNLFDNKVPAYASYVLFEFHKSHNNHYIKIIHQDNSNPVPPKVLTLPGCEEMCPLEKFVQLTSKVIPGDNYSC